MHTRLTLLDRALILAQHELDAMRSGDVEGAEVHFDERKILMDQAYATLDESDPDDYRVKLIALQGYNQMIYEEGKLQLDKIRQNLLRSRESSRQAKGYARISILQ